jgi:preprotein translocase subunit SecE
MPSREVRRVQEKTKQSAQKQRMAAQRKKASDKKKGEKKGAWKTVTQFLKDVKIEMKKVIWPSREEVINYTIVVLITVAVVSTFILVMDFGLQHLLTLVTKGLFP